MLTTKDNRTVGLGTLGVGLALYGIIACGLQSTEPATVERAEKAAELLVDEATDRCEKYLATEPPATRTRATCVLLIQASQARDIQIIEAPPPSSSPPVTPETPVVPDAGSEVGHG